MLIEYLNKIPDKRRGQGRQYQLGYVILFSLFAILAGADGYAAIARFIDEYFYKLDDMFDMGWTRPPHENTIKGILKSIDAQELEKTFREYTLTLVKSDKSYQYEQMAIDGKTLRKSFDKMKDQKSLHLLSIFAVDRKLIFAHKEVGKKSNEIPTAQELIEEIGLSDYIFTADALHCQKNL